MQLSPTLRQPGFVVLVHTLRQAEPPHENRSLPAGLLVRAQELAQFAPLCPLSRQFWRHPKDIEQEPSISQFSTCGQHCWPMQLPHAPPPKPAQEFIPPPHPPLMQGLEQPPVVPPHANPSG